LGELLANFAEKTGFDDDLFRERPWKEERPLGSDFLEEE
jgi:hypothetical protein